MQSNVKYPKRTNKINWNSKHSDYPDASVKTTDFKNLEQIQPTIMMEKVVNIAQAINEGKSFNPFILYPNSFKIFDGNHRYMAIKYLFGENTNMKVPYIEKKSEPEVKTLNDATQQLEKVLDQIKKDSGPVTSTTQAVYNPVHSPVQRPPDEKPGEPNPPAKPDANKEKEAEETKKALNIEKAILIGLEKIAKADYPWDKCIADQKKEGYSDEKANEICGAIRARSQHLGSHKSADNITVAKSYENYEQAIKEYIEKNHSDLTDIQKESMNDCIARKIPIIARENPDKKHDAVVGEAAGWCKENRKDN